MSIKIQTIRYKPAVSEMKLLLIASLFVLLASSSAKKCGSAHNGVECPTGGRCCYPPKHCHYFSHSNAVCTSDPNPTPDPNLGCHEANTASGCETPKTCCGNVCCSSLGNGKCCQEGGRWKCNCKDKDVEEEP